MENAVGYVRVSTDEQKKFGLSLDAQEERLHEYAEDHGLRLIRIYRDEGVSGRKPIDKRPALREMLQDAAGEEFTRVLFWRLDRFFRNVGEYNAAVKILNEHHVEWSCTDEQYDTTTASGRYLINAKVAIAELEADQTGERIRLTNDYKVRRGSPLCGKVPYGFKIANTAEGKKIVIDREKEPVVRALIDHFLMHHNKSRALMHIRDAFNTDDITFYMVGTLLKSSLLCGRYRDNDSFCEAYITPAEYDEIQRALSKNQKTPPSGRAYLFSGLIPCPHCGCLMQAHYRYLRAGVNRRKTDGEYYFYRCQNTYKDRTCDFRKFVNEEKLERRLMDMIDTYAVERIKSVTVQDAKGNTVDISKKLRSIKGEQSRLTKIFLKGRIDEKTYDREYAQLEEQIKEIEFKKPDASRDLSAVRELLSSDWQTMYEHLDRPHRKTFWQKLLNRIIIDENASLVSVDFTD